MQDAGRVLLQVIFEGQTGAGEARLSDFDK
jgi:hypothetical protein